MASSRAQIRDHQIPPSWGDSCVPEEGDFFYWRVQPAPPPLLEITGSETLGILSLRTVPFVGQEQCPPPHHGKARHWSLGSTPRFLSVGVTGREHSRARSDVP